jgi:signal transduction histidine kinase
LEQSYRKAFAGEFLEFSDSYLTQQGVQHFRVNINPVFSSDRVIGATVFAKNVTELEQFMQTIKKQNERFREISWLQSHVVRAPLARLMGLLDLLQEDFSIADSDQLGYLEKMKKASLELDKVIREINHKSEDLI